MKILLPQDGSELALEAVRYAIRLCDEGLDATFVLVNVQEPATLYEMVVAPDAETIARASADAGHHALTWGREMLGEAELDWGEEVVAGDPAHAIIALIEEHGIDAVIIASHGKGAVRSALMGSVTQRLLHDCPVPVTVVKPPPESDDSDNAAADA
jgi:nucleotide-binding universal stress UspA family protein